MRALRIHAYGGPEVMRVENVALPVPAAGQVLVKVAAASVNPIDWKMRRGMLASVFPLSFPRTLGRDCAGDVDGRLHAGVADPRGEGTHAEYALLPQGQCAPLPEGLEPAAAASLCVSGLSAYIPLAEVARLAPGMKVLIHAGAGGVGSLAIQIARHLGAEVVATAGAANREYCEALGASRVVDYRREDFAAAGPFDMVLDSLGGESHARSVAALAPGGRVLALQAAPIPGGIDKGLAVMVQIQPSRERLERIFAWATAGVLRPQVTQSFSLEQAAEAYRLSEAGHLRGKIVILP